MPARVYKRETNRGHHHEQREVRFLRAAMNEPDPQERQRLLALAHHAKGQAKLYRMVERRGCDKPTGLPKVR